MEEEQLHSDRRIVLDDYAGPSSTLFTGQSSARDFEEETESEPTITEVHPIEGDEPIPVSENAANHHRRRRHRPGHQHQPRSTRFDFTVTDSAGNSNNMRDDVWSCLVVLVTFWFFASMTLILGFYGSEDLQIGPYYSRLISANQFFVQSIKIQQIEEQIKGPMLYGFHKRPPLDIETSWSETHNASVQPNFHKEWMYYLNEGSNVDISYEVLSPTSAVLSLVIAQGSESLYEWVDDPSYPDTTLSWNVVNGSGTIKQEISSSASYYIAVGNLNSETVEVQLNFTIEAVRYNTSQSYSKCSLYSRVCSVKLSFFTTSYGVITSPGPEEFEDNTESYMRLSYGPRWLTYGLGSVVMTTLVLSLCKFCNMFLPGQEDFPSGGGSQPWGDRNDQQPLLEPKDDDTSSLGSSYDSVSNDEDDLEERIPPPEGKAPLVEGESSNSTSSRDTRNLCVICFNSPRDCFFLPCGHCAACFTCGSRIAEEAGRCPICRRNMKKVRRIFSV